MPFSCANRTPEKKKTIRKKGRRGVKGNCIFPEKKLILNFNAN
jgi:hypothetical protein